MKNCFFISNKLCDKLVLDRLRSILIEASQYIANRQHPIVFLNIEKACCHLIRQQFLQQSFIALPMIVAFWLSQTVKN